MVTRLVDQLSKQLSDRIAQSNNETDAAAMLAQLARDNLPQQPPSPNPTTIGNQERPTVTQLLETLKSSDVYAGQILDEASTTIPAQPAKYHDAPSSIDPIIWQALSLERLYSHQAQAIEAAMQGCSVVISTSTASGKSTAYQAPLLQHLLSDPQKTSLLVFPTKALAQDQLQTLSGLLHMVPKLKNIKIGTFDGDTTLDISRRHEIIDTYSVILTNPDSLHMSILPNFQRWQRFLDNLQMVVLDEVHVYHGVFGQHVAMIIARLQRLTRSSVQFIACSATASSHPADHMQQLTHCKDSLVVVDSDGSAHGTRHLVAWKTQAMDKQPFSDTAYVASHLVRNNMRTLLFCKTRNTCELLFMEIQRLMDNSPRLRQFRHRVMSYRGGYAPQERREIEKALFSGITSLVICTSALELGIDVGSLDCVVMHGLPVSAASMWQQIGRAGRLMQDSLAVVMLTDDLVDQQAARFPERVFQRHSERLSIATQDSVTLAHMQCAAFDRPINPDCIQDQRFLECLSNKATSLLDSLLWDPVAKRHFCKLSYKPWPAQKISIRGSQNNTKDEWNVLLIPSLTLLEILDPMHALLSLYEGGIFLHRGLAYSIDKVDPDTRVALVSLARVSWYTRKRDIREVQPLDTLISMKIHKRESSQPICVFYGQLQIITRVFGYHRIAMQSKKIIETIDQKSPDLCTHTRGLWIDLPLSICHQLAQSNHDVESSIHAVQHLLIKCIAHPTTDSFLCTEDDLETECKSPLATRSRVPRLVVYEKCPARDHPTADNNDGGPTRRALEHICEILCTARTAVDTCKCTDAQAGCTECVGMRKGCSENNQCLDKLGARLILQLLLPK
ncbi:ATP-dependent 3'-5' DNA helicase [Coemansia asiatica]|nr:ATP-dependent 3'-5' DNA helicase [Coemansia asiatica]